MRSILQILLVFIVSTATILDAAHASTRSDYRAVEATNTIDAYKSFLATHPKGKYAKRAQRRLEVLEEAQYVESVCPGKSIDAVPGRGPYYLEAGGRIIRRSDNSMMRDAGIDIATIDSNWSGLVCGMTIAEVDALTDVGWSVNLLTQQGLTQEIVLIMGKRQLVFQNTRLVQARGPTEIGLQ